MSRRTGIPAWGLGLSIVGAAAIGGFLGNGSDAGPTTTTTTVITEDEPRWDCRTMGNHICGEPDAGHLVIYFTLGDQVHGFDLNAPDRPGCFVEPSDTPAGYEVIFRPDISQDDDLGFEVVCP